MSGDPFLAEFEAHLPKLRRFAKVFGGADADDLFQDTCEKVLRYRDTYQLGTNFMGWAYRIMRNSMISKARANKVRRSMDLFEIEGKCDGAQFATVQLTELTQHMNKLNPLTKQAVLLSALGYRLDEISSLMGGMTTGTCKSRVSRGRAILRAAQS